MSVDFPGTRNTGHGHEQPQWKVHRQVTEIVGLGSDDRRVFFGSAAGGSTARECGVPTEIARRKRVGCFSTSATEPSATTSPNRPARGQVDQMIGRRMVSSSCSTTITVLPSPSSRSVLRRRSLSRWCKPMLGSSRM